MTRELLNREIEAASLLADRVAESEAWYAADRRIEPEERRRGYGTDLVRQ